MKIIAIIQARLGSTRLPEKVLKPILEHPMLWWDVYRLRQARYIDQIVIATTTESQDDAISELCEAESWAVYRGSENDVLDRYYQAAQHFKASHILRITSDCPLIDPTLIDNLITTCLSSAPSIDYVSNTLQRTYPRGLDAEIFTMDVLQQIWQKDQSSWREHVTPYIYNHPEAFGILNISNHINFSKYRWTVDTPEDLQLVRKIYDYFGHGDFRWQDVILAFNKHPEWLNINQHNSQKKI